MNINLEKAAALVGGNIIGDSGIEIKKLARIEEAEEGDLTFLYHPSYEKFFPLTKASAILVNPGFKRTRRDMTYIEVKDPNKAFSKILAEYFTPEFELKGIDESAFVHPGAEVGKNVSLGRNVVVSEGCVIGDNVKIFHNTVLLENVEVGEGTLLFQNVSVREKCRIGRRVIIHPNTVIGSDGFGFYTDNERKYNKIPQIGIVIIEDDVELGSNVSIDRAALGATIIKRGVKIDNLVQIAHNVVVGEDTVISSQTGISGSTKIGNNCIIAGQVGIVGHIEIADNVIIMAQSGISKSITKSGAYFGTPAKEQRTALKLEAHFRNFPEYVEKIKALENRVKELSDELKELSGRD